MGLRPPTVRTVLSFLTIIRAFFHVLTTFTLVLETNACHAIHNVPMDAVAQVHRSVHHALLIITKVFVYQLAPLEHMLTVQMVVNYVTAIVMALVRDLALMLASSVKALLIKQGLALVPALR